MKFRIHFFVAAVAAVAVFASGALVSEAMMKNQKDLVRAAKKEGAVTIINPLFSDRTAKRMGPAFAKHYGLGSGFKFRNLRKGTGATVSQVRQEMRAKKFTVDVHVVSAPGFFAAAQKRGAYHKLDSAEWNKHFAAVIKNAGQYANYPYVVTPLAYTFQPVWNIACPGMKDINVTSYADTFRQARERLGESHALVLHQELKDVAPRPAAEALVDAHARVHVERRRLLVMERTKPLVVRARFLEAHELADDVFNRSAVPYLIDHLFRHSSHYCILIPKSKTSAQGQLHVRNAPAAFLGPGGAELRHERMLLQALGDHLGEHPLPLAVNDAD